RFLKPYDKAMLDMLAQDHDILITLEESSPRGGLRDTVLQHFQNNIQSPTIHSFSLPDAFVTHGKRDDLIKDIHLTVDDITKNILSILKK
ncbi:MAG: 1-deoxy-D-xylulose-5-phosphate synthase, partial [Candidatus Marinimicrobia bacterium]|nr:1-deoxy-D-xylulose-5-phosphate synthase [Candidatus Neomarinimicrobiota bacterium]